MFKLFEKIKKYLCICVITSTLCQFIVPLGVYARTGITETKEIIEIRKNKDIENLKKEKQNQYKSQKELEAKIVLITKELNELMKEIKNLKKQNKTKQERISNISSKILNTTNEIADIDFEIQKLTEETQELNAQLLNIMRVIYTENGIGIFNNPFSANNFVEFDNSVKYSQKFSEFIEQTVRTYNEKIREIDKNKNNRENEVKKISSEQEEIEQSVEQNNIRSTQLEELMQKCMQKYDELKSHLKEIKNKTTVTENAMKTLGKIDKKLSKKIEIPPIEEPNKASNNITQTQTKNEETQKKQETPPANSNGHVFPVLGNCSIFQGFRKGHPAIDIQTYGKPNPVVASKSGTVVVAGRGGKGNKMSGYGNVVRIKHENGEETLYAHLSAFKVVAGQKVNQGQVIGNVGNTGAVSGRTGMHLHYERIVNGVRVNPTFVNYKTNPAPKQEKPKPAPAQKPAQKPTPPAQQNTKNRSPNNTKSKSTPKNNKSKQGNKIKG